MDTPTSSIEDDYDNDIPLQRRRAFGTGLLKKTIAFVPAIGKTDTVTALSIRQRAPNKLANIYLDMVLAQDSSRESTPSSVSSEELEPELPKACDICQHPISLAESSTHESSLSHQLCLHHSHQPSALDRSRMGLSYLQTHGWDPDSRKGLGASYQGIPHPIKPKPKDDKLGIGITVPKNLPLAEKEKNKGKPLGAGKVRKLVKDEKRKVERIRRQLFGFGNKDLEKYLGSKALG